MKSVQKFFSRNWFISFHEFFFAWNFKFSGPLWNALYYFEKSSKNDQNYWGRKWSKILFNSLYSIQLPMNSKNRNAGFRLKPNPSLSPELAGMVDDTFNSLSSVLESSGTKGWNEAAKQPSEKSSSCSTLVSLRGKSNGSTK